MKSKLGINFTFLRMGRVTKIQVFNSRMGKWISHKQYLYWPQIRGVLDMVDKLRTKKEGLKKLICQILQYIYYLIFITILWSRYSYSSSTDTKRIRKVRHLAQSHTISLLAGSNFKTQFACSESCLHSTKTEWICFRNTFWEKSYYQR